MLFKVLRHSREQHTLQFFVDVVEESRTMFDQNLLGRRSIDTTDPESIKGVHSTNFTGIFPMDT